MAAQPLLRPALDDDQLDRVLRALADRTRRAILVRLSQGEATIGQLAEPFDMSLPAVSKHVRALERAGLIQRTIEGRTHHCRLDPRTLDETMAWLTLHRSFWNETLDSLADYVEGRASERSS